jgi:hypothetical protein
MGYTPWIQKPLLCRTLRVCLFPHTLFQLPLLLLLGLDLLLLRR